MNWILELLSVGAGLLTVLSPCILPVLPPLLSASAATQLRHRPFWIVLGLISSFTLFGTTFALFGTFLGLSNALLRQMALAVLFFFGLTLIWPGLWEKIGGRIGSMAQRMMGTPRPRAEQGRLSSLLIGASLGLVWAPCAGPILGIIITLAAVQKSFASTLLLMSGYSLGAAVPMLLIGYGGQKISGQLKRFRSWGSVSHKLLGFFTLATVIGLFFNVETLLLSHLPGQFFITNKIEKEWLEKKDSSTTSPDSGPKDDFSTGVVLASEEKSELPVLGRMPEFSGITTWINSPGLASSNLRGKVVLIDFWTYSCINCIRTLPYVTQWYEKYKDQGLIVVGVHTPEFGFEKEETNVKQAVIRHGIHYPVAMDNDYGTWNTYHNHYWPAHYLIDDQGNIREEHFGEGDYEETEWAIQTLLGKAKLLQKPMSLEGPKKAVDFSKIHSPETYIGYGRAENFSSPQRIFADASAAYSAPPALRLNQWALKGLWKITKEAALLQSSHGAVQFRFDAPKLNLVMEAKEKGLKAKVFLDGKPVPPDFRGDDVGLDGTVTITGSRLYHLVTLPEGSRKDHLFELLFEKPNAMLYAFTFG